MVSYSKWGAKIFGVATPIGKVVSSALTITEAADRYNSHVSLMKKYW